MKTVAWTVIVLYICQIVAFCNPERSSNIERMYRWSGRLGFCFWAGITVYFVLRSRSLTRERKTFYSVTLAILVAAGLVANSRIPPKVYSLPSPITNIEFDRFLDEAISQAEPGRTPERLTCKVCGLVGTPHDFGTKETGELIVGKFVKQINCPRCGSEVEGRGIEAQP